MAEKIFIFDTTLRDGEQSPGCSMNLDEKLGMARQLDRLGVDILEAGFPIASQGDFEAVKAISAEIRRPVIAALARASELDIKRAWEALKGAERPRIHTFLATSDIHLKYKLRKTREDVLKQISASVGLAASLCPDVEFSPEDAGRTDRNYLIECCQADRKSTRLNSSHVAISYAVFCLKKKQHYSHTHHHHVHFKRAQPTCCRSCREVFSSLGAVGSAPDLYRLSR